MNSWRRFGADLREGYTTNHEDIVIQQQQVNKNSSTSNLLVALNHSYCVDVGAWQLHTFWFQLLIFF